jgi:FMN phosphatase YigB (HAD superfamily)
MIKAVLFDFGGVLAAGGKAGQGARILSKLYGIDETHVHLRLTRRLFLRMLMAGDRFVAGLCRLFPGAWRVVEPPFIAHFAPAFVRNESVYTLAAALRAADVQTGIFSNVFTVLADAHKRRGDYDGFSPVVLSCAEGTAKPDIELYRRVLDRLHLSAEEVLFIDDKEVCLVPARYLGMQTLLAKSPKQIVTDVQELLQRENKLTFAK